MISKKTTIKTIVTLLLVVLCGMLFAFLQYNKPHTNVASSEADITLTAQALFSDFESEEELANSKYLDKIIQVTGPVTNMTTVKGQMIISMGSEDAFGSVKCHLTPEETAKGYDLKEGQIITLKGICTGYLMDVILVKAVLIN